MLYWSLHHWPNGCLPTSIESWSVFNQPLDADNAVKKGNPIHPEIENHSDAAMLREMPLLFAQCAFGATKELEPVFNNYFRQNVCWSIHRLTPESSQFLNRYSEPENRKVLLQNFNTFNKYRYTGKAITIRWLPGYQIRVFTGTSLLLFALLPVEGASTAGNCRRMGKGCCTFCSQHLSCFRNLK